MNSSKESIYAPVNAVKYAMQYALNPNPDYRYFLIYGRDGGDCANFLSQCLRAGGSPMKVDSRNPWWYNNNGTKTVKNHTFSVSWSLAHSLYWYLKRNQANNLYGAKGLEVESLGMLELGDVIFFENNKGSIYHSAIVTSFIDKYPLISHHSPEVFNIPFKTWNAAKIHFLKIII